MSNIIEIKGDSSLISIDWLIHSVCNYKCAYCNVNTGTYGFPDLEIAKKAVDTLRMHYGEKRIRFQFSGGEPTVWKEFPLLIDHIYTKNNCFVDIATNGCVSHKYWQRIVKPNMKIIFSHHYEELESIDKFIESYASCNASHKKIILSMIPEKFDEILSHYHLIRERFPNDPISCKALDNRHLSKTGFQKNLLNYTATQLTVMEELNTKHSNKYTAQAITDTGEVFSIEPFSMLVNEKNKFKGWSCHAGLEKLVFHYDGTIKRANCFSNDVNFGNWRFGIIDALPTEPIICSKDKCGAVTELSISKKKL